MAAAGMRTVMARRHFMWLTREGKQGKEAKGRKQEGKTRTGKGSRSLYTLPTSRSPAPEAAVLVVLLVAVVIVAAVVVLIVVAVVVVVVVVVAVGLCRCLHSLCG